MLRHLQVDSGAEITAVSTGVWPALQLAWRIKEASNDLISVTNIEHSMGFSKSLPAALAFSIFASFAPAHANILSAENLSDTYWLPKHREPNDRTPWIQMHLKRFMLLAGKDGRLDEQDLARQRKAGDERTELRARLSFLSVDNDLDGTITLDEMKEFDFSDGARTEDPAVRFTRIDESKDGIVLEREWFDEEFRQQAKRDKLNHDYTGSEFAQYWGVDPKKDKVLTSDEYEAALGQLYDQYDADKDGHLSETEADKWQSAVLTTSLVDILKEYPEFKKNLGP